MVIDGGIESIKGHTNEVLYPAHHQYWQGSGLGYFFLSPHPAMTGTNCEARVEPRVGISFFEHVDTPGASARRGLRPPRRTDVPHHLVVVCSPCLDEELPMPHRRQTPDRNQPRDRRDGTIFFDVDRWAAAVVHRNQKKEVPIPPLILLAEDDEAYREVLTEKMVADGYHVAGTENGLHAVRLLRTGLAEETNAFLPDLIVSDIRMPRLDGFELLEQVRLLKPEIPTILLTGFGDEICRQRAERLGCEQLLDKPVSYQTLSYHMDRLLLASALL